MHFPIGLESILKWHWSLWYKNANGRFTIDRAFILADAAPNTAIAQYMGKLDRYRRIVFCPDFFLFQLNGFIGYGTHLFTNNARLVIRPGDAATLVDISFADRALLLFFQAQWGNRLHGAYLSTEVAGEVAVSHAWDQDRRPEAFGACLEGRWLKGIGRTASYTIRTTNTLRQA